jgi:TATA-binding protein-associated factor
LQARFARSVASFIAFCSSPHSPVKSNPTDKIIKNLSTFVCQDSTQTPIFATAKVTLDGILTLREQQDAAAVIAASTGKAKEALVIESEEVVQARITSRGAKLAFAELARTFGERLADEVPKLWSCMTVALSDTFASQYPVPFCPSPFAFLTR